MSAARPRFLAFLVGPSLALGSSLAIAAPPDLAADPPAIVGGTPTSSCGWAPVVALANAGAWCTGTLVDPEIIVYAAHCGIPTKISFGPLASFQVSDVGIDHCALHPQWQADDYYSGYDLAYCKLSEPMLDVEPLRVAAGCELDVLAPGMDVTIIGFGYAELAPNPAFGIKRAVDVPLVEVGNMLVAGGQGASGCHGDSGGPLAFRLPAELDPEQSWRLAGVTMGSALDVDDCTLGSYSWAERATAWIEAESGVDITPCHDAQGNWQPTPACGGALLSPGEAAGVWPTCEPAQLGGALATCGAPAAPQDLDPPTASLDAPTQGSEFVSDGDLGFALVSIDATVEDVGWGLAQVELLVGDQVAATRSTPPWSWEAQLYPGAYFFSVRATDLAGNVGESELVGVGVDQPAPEPPSEDSTTGSSEESGSDTTSDSADATGSSADEVGEGAGSSSEAGGCRLTGSKPLAGVAWGWLAALAGLGLRRRRALSSP